MQRLICSTGSYKGGLRSHTNRWDDPFKDLLDAVSLSKNHKVFVHIKKLGGWKEVICRTHSL